MEFDNHRNLAVATVASAPEPATSGQTLTLQTDEGTLFDERMPVTICPPNVLPTDANAEIGYLTAVDGDELTFDRAQEGSEAKAIRVGWKVYGSITAKTFEDIEQTVMNAVAALATKEPAIPAGTAEQYFRGDKTLGSFGRSNVYSPATFVVAPANSGFKADYYTDGTADEVQINQALVAAAAQPTGGVVRLKAGTYTISAPVKPLNNTKLQGDGMTSTIIKGAGSDFTALDNRDGTTLNPTHDVEICDLKIDMDAVTVVSADPIDVKCIFITCVLRFFVHGVWLYGSPGTGLGTDFLVDTIFDRCLVEKCGKAGLAGTNQRLIGCNGFGIGSGRYDNESWIVSNCIAKNIGNNGFLLENLNSNKDSLNNQFVNCIAYECGIAGFNVTGVSQVIASNCIAYKNYEHGFFINSDDAGSTTNPKRVLLNNCISSHNGTSGQNSGDGFYIVDFFTAGNRLKNITLMGCISFANSNHGIRVRDAKGIIISGCRSEGNRNQGIILDSTKSTNPVTDISITGCHVLNNSNPALGSTTDHDGILIQIPTNGGAIANVVIANNRCYDDQAVKTQRFGINISASASIADITVLGNDLTGNKDTNPLFIGSSTGKVIVSNNLGVSETVVRTGTTTVGRTESVILYNNTSPVTATLPDATKVPPQRRVTIKDYRGSAATNNITVATMNSQTIDGVATKTINANYGSLSFISDGSNWFVV
ncbi:glycosyl hydrolase family 28-related protein [Nocardia sp. NPDC050697]|uniref:right-handed parallel beta-helix repeat-containing protein n=1 Tax=Nocardia sp. NPDC050697 TaxID=3155158 RepID=UPI0033CC2B55